MCGVEIAPLEIAVRLESVNPEVPSVRLRLSALDDLRAIAVFDRVLRPG